MEWLLWSLFLLFAVFGLGCLGLVALGLPGTWILIGAAVVIELLDGVVLGGDGAGATSPSTFGWPLLLGSIAMAGVGEGLEFASGAAGAKLGGSTRRGMWFALLGGIVGAIVLTPLLPIPVVGTLVGALLGTFLGAWLGEATSGEARSREETLRAALAAVVGHLAGIVAKLAIGVAVWVLLLRAVIPV